MKNYMTTLGIDIGSTTVKIAILDTEGNILFSVERCTIFGGSFNIFGRKRNSNRIL